MRTAVKSKKIKTVGWKSDGVISVRLCDTTTFLSGLYIIARIASLQACAFSPMSMKLTMRLNGHRLAPLL